MTDIRLMSKQELDELNERARARREANNPVQDVPAPQSTVQMDLFGGMERSFLRSIEPDGEELHAHDIPAIGLKRCSPIGAEQLEELKRLRPNG